MEQRVRQLLLFSMAQNPLAEAFGCLIGTSAAIISARAAAQPIITEIAYLLIGAVILRILAAIGLRLSSPATLMVGSIAYQVAAGFYSALLGLLSGAVVLLDAQTPVQLLMISVTVGYATTVPVRNAGQPLVAFIQPALALAPFGVASVLEGSPSAFALGAITLAAIPAIWTTVPPIHRLLHDSIETAETSAHMAERMKALAQTDTVTGLLNRAGLDQAIAELAAALQPPQQVALLWLDLDRFKQVNDVLGHHAGDQVLREVARRVRDEAPGDAIIARFGGDEFVIACRVANARAAENLASRLLAAMREPIWPALGSEPARGSGMKPASGGSSVFVGVSIGIALLPHDGPDVEAGMQAADLALYNAKLNGRGQAVFYAPEMSRELAVRRQIETDLRHALHSDELSVFFQPIIDLSTGRIRTFEALVRWFHPHKGEVTPDEFIPVAEESGVIVALGIWITAHAARAAAAWPADITLAVNLSPLQIRAPGAAVGILAALRQTGLPPHRLELEITESVLLDDSPGTAAFIAELSAAGVRFALDDFGTGYSSLSYLSRYNFSRIKVDRSFVSGEHANTRGSAIIGAVAQMASTLDMELVAEGIETVEQAAAMAELGCRLGQGFYFSRPVPDYLAAILLAHEREALPGLRLVS